MKKARILTKEMELFIEEELKRNDELISTAIKILLVRKWPDLKVSLLPFVEKLVGYVPGHVIAS